MDIRSRFDQARHHAAIELPPEHIGDFQRLVKNLRFGSARQTLIVEYNDETYRDALIARLDDILIGEGLSPAILSLAVTECSDSAALAAELERLAGEHQAIHVTSGDRWFDEKRWQTLNILRETIAQRVHSRLVFWLTEKQIARLAELAPDLWAWRGGVFSFATGVRIPRETPVPVTDPVDQRSLAERCRRISELRAWLADDPPPPDELKLPLLDELAGLYQSIGDFDDALRIRREEELPVQERCGNLRAKAITMSRIADILQIRGQLDEALRIRTDEELPVFEQLGDARAKAVTMGNIADILQVRGQFDEALRIRREEELPVYVRLGDVRAKAASMGKIAEILLARGQLDEAQRILSDEVLPEFGRLADVRSEAITIGRIADILHARGQLDEALRILNDQVLPAFGRLGDARSKAVTLGKIADILQARGQVDEALRIYTDEELPVYERLGDVRSKAVTLSRIADILQARGQLEAALALHRQRLPMVEGMRDADGIAHAHFSIARIQLDLGEHERGELQTIHEHLEKAFSISLQMHGAYAIASIGPLLAQVLAMRGEKDAALAALEQAEIASAKLDDKANTERIRQLRSQIDPSTS